MKIHPFVIFLFILFVSCTDNSKKEKTTTPKEFPGHFLPFKEIPLNDLVAFKKTAGNWKIAGNVQADRNKEKTLRWSKGTGILVNIPEEGKKGNLFTSFDHGDLELELDIMMPVKSNSGIYFQGRYELQLLDSWGVKDPGYGDMGGIYERWDDTKEEGKKGYEGTSPKINAAKAPGLWQHLKVIFQAPEFDDSGKKVKNAIFQEVWLNGVLIHEDQELTGPTRGPAFENESSMAPLMIQGDHGPVAFKNIRYKLYGDNKISLSAILMTAYENQEEILPVLDSLDPIRETKTDSISSLMVSDGRAQEVLKYTGTIDIPESGDYIFDLKLNVAGGLLLIDKDTIVNMNGSYNLDSLGIAKVNLKNGYLPFTLIYNKHVPWRIGFSLEVEGPGIQKHLLTTKSSLDLSKDRPEESIMVKALEQPVTQRSFLMFNGQKRTHCISVGTLQKINYSYDLAAGSLLQVWDQDFLDATGMWYGRGEKQLGRPSGFIVAFHGDPEMAVLEDDTSIWPETIQENAGYKPNGYELDKEGIPSFLYKIGDTYIRDKLIPAASERRLNREIAIESNTAIYHKLGEGEAIEKLDDGTYIINDESYYILFPDKASLQPVIRNSEGKNELLVEIPAGKQKINYSIIW